jgi:hypothetical protein
MMHDRERRPVSASAISGKRLRDGHHRLKRRQTMLADTLRGADIPVTAVIPGMGNRLNLPIDEQVALLVATDSLRLVTEKIARGIFYIADGKFIEPPYEIDFFVLDEEGAQDWKEALDKFGSVYAREPGIVVGRAVAPDDNTSSLIENLETIQDIRVDHEKTADLLIVLWSG